MKEKHRAKHSFHTQSTDSVPASLRTSVSPESAYGTKDEENSSKTSIDRETLRQANTAEPPKQCTCESKCEPGASNINCAIHGCNPDFPRGSYDAALEEIEANTIGAIKEYHGHKRFDINEHVERSESSEIEDEVMRTALNGVLHMGSTDPEQRRKMKELADRLTNTDMRQRKSVKVAIQEESTIFTHKNKKRVSPDSIARMLRQVQSGEHFKEPSPQIPPRMPLLPQTPLLQFRKNQKEMDPDDGRMPTNMNDQRMPTNKIKNRVPSHRLRAKSIKAPPETVSMPMQPPPLGYRWSYRRFLPDNEKHKIVDHRHYISPPFKWILVPTNLKIKKKKSYDYMRDAKYGYRNQMDPKDFSVINYYNFPPYCYSIIEPLRFPYHNFNSPPFPKRAPLDFICDPYGDESEEDSTTAEEKIRQEDARLSKSIIKRWNWSKPTRSKVETDTRTDTRDVWAGYKPKYIKSPIKSLWKNHGQPATLLQTTKRKRSYKLKANEVIPKVMSKTLFKGQSVW